MLKFFYTGASTWNNSQNQPSKSLGGYISNTTIPNGLTNSLFSDLSESDLYEEKIKKEIIGIALYPFFFIEEEKTDKINIEVNLITNNEEDENTSILQELKKAFKFYIGLGPISGNSTSGYYMEQIQDGNSKPYYLFEDWKELSEEKIVFENLSSEGIGVWIYREFNPKITNKLFQCCSDYWKENDNLPNLEFPFNININLKG